MSVELIHQGGPPNPIFSIIIPTMNLEEWRVRNCLWSLRQQTEQNVEIIISDINSDAEHLESLRQLSERFDATLYHAKRDVWSITLAYNIGIRRSRGRCAATIDADIIFEPKVVEDTLWIFGGRSKQAVIRQPIFLGVGVDCSSLNFPAAYKELSKQPDLYIAPSVGSFFCAPRDWWFKVRGYDERFQMYGIEDWEIWKRSGRDKLRKVFIGKKCKLPIQPPRGGCKLYHQFHLPFQKRAGISIKEYNLYRERNRLIYDGDTSIIRNDENWGLIKRDLAQHTHQSISWRLHRRLFPPHPHQ